MSMSSSFFSFPNPVNDVAARSVAAGVVVMAAVALATHQLWLTIPLAYGFVARVACGPRFSPLGLIATRIIAPRLGSHAKLVPGPPKRFAQGMGAVFTVAALLAWALGSDLGADVLLGLLLLPASLEAGFGYCVGCKLFAFGIRSGLVPEEVCLECGDLYGPEARRRRGSSARKAHLLNPRAPRSGAGLSGPGAGVSPRSGGRGHRGRRSVTRLARAIEAPHGIVLVALAVLAGQLSTGWQNDALDADQDRQTAARIGPSRSSRAASLARRSRWRRSSPERRASHCHWHLAGRLAPYTSARSRWRSRTTSA